MFQKWVDKIVFVQLKNGRIYNGKILEVKSLEANPDIFLIAMIDKLGKDVMFYSSELEVIEQKLESEVKREEDW